MGTMVVVGGNKSSVRHLERACPGVKIMFHDPSVSSKQNHRDLERAIRCADCVVVMIDGCSHKSMWDTRSIAKQYDVPVRYNRGFGLSRIRDVMPL